MTQFLQFNTAKPFFAAGLALALSCSGTYPLGDLSEATQPVLSPNGSDLAQGDATVSTALPPPDVTIGGTFGGIGTVAANVGDLDGDGYDELVGVERDVGTGVDAVRIRYGGVRPSNSVGDYVFSESGVHLLASFSNSFVFLGDVASAGDVNGDGFADLLVGTFRCQPALAGEGVYLLLGGAERLEGTQDLSELATLFSAPNSEGLPSGGCSAGPRHMVSPGDLDLDGYDDLLVVDNDFDWQSPSPDSSALYVFYGSAEAFPPTVNWHDAPVRIGSDVTLTVSSVGDVTGNGHPEVLIERQFATAEDQAHSVALLRHGDERWSGDLKLTEIEQELASARVGTHPGTTTVAGDLDGDGLFDLILADENNTVHLFYGDEELFEGGFDFASADAILVSSHGLSHVGFAGDLDGDGDSEIFSRFHVGAEAEDPELLFDTEVTILSGSSTRISGETQLPGIEVRGESSEGRFGKGSNRYTDGLVPAGDLDGDGYGDLFTMSSYYESLGSGQYDIGSRQLHVHYGAADMSIEPSIVR